MGECFIWQLKSYPLRERIMKNKAVRADPQRATQSRQYRGTTREDRRCELGARRRVVRQTLPLLRSSMLGGPTPRGLPKADNIVAGRERTDIVNLGLRDRSCHPPLMALFLLGGEDLRDVCPLTPCHDIVLFGQPSGGRASWLCFSSGEKGLVIGGGEQCAYKSECGGGGGMGMTGGGCEEKIFVLVRLRPLNEKETARNDLCDWECINEDTIIFKNYRVFRSDCSTKEVYEKEAKDVALSVVSGINSTVFAYGQTSSGKTFTMMGITEYAVADIYYYIIEKHNEREFLLKFSAMEIHNESVRDLLSTDSTPLRLLDDPERTVIEKLTEEPLRDWNHVMELLSICDDKLGQTALNETSSRSHQIIGLTIESSARQFLGKDNLSTLTAAVEWINFVDLGGSERTSQSLSAGTRLKAGCHINRSLLTLGTVIRKLRFRKLKGRNGHVPFRDSKLTRILQSSLGDNARTAIICTMGPREVMLSNQEIRYYKALVKHLQRELARLESELRSQGHTFVASHYSALLREKGLQIEKLEKEMIDLTVQRDLAKSQVGFNNYPHLQVRKSPECENPVPDTSPLASPHSLDIGVRSVNRYLYSYGHGGRSSDDHYIQILPEFEENK
ncbi:unnamed protein product [Camellia sinensis]